MQYQWIKTKEQLDTVCEAARQQSVVMLDTEFVRVRSFYPKLGLIQLYDGETVSLIDPLSIADMGAFRELLVDQSVLKVLHACGEDLEVFLHHFNAAPEPLVDTQLMAAFLGFGVSVGFAALVNEFVGVELDKSESRADWLARPLTAKQKDYAAADVLYLLPVFEQLKAKVDEQGWWQASLEESLSQIDKRKRPVELDRAYLNVKAAWQLQPNQLATLKLLASWRLEEALRRDLALNFVCRDNDLLTISKLGLINPRRMVEEGVDEKMLQRHGNKLSQLVKQAYALDESEYPAAIVPISEYPGYKQLFKTLKDVVSGVASQTGLAAEFLASRKQLNQLISWVWKKQCAPESAPEIITGWRAELVGEKVLAKIPKRD